MQGKLNLFLDNLETAELQPDILIFSESWLREEIEDCELGLTNYQIFRTDRKHRQGGRVLIAISNSISCRLVSSLTYLASEHLIVVLEDYKIALVVSYFSPATSPLLNNDLNEFTRMFIYFSDFMNGLYGDGMFQYSPFLIGDYNLPATAWIRTDDNILFHAPTRPYLSNSISVSAEILCNLCNTLNLFQHFSNHTLKNYSLDLLFCTDDYRLHFEHLQQALAVEDEKHHNYKFLKIKNCVYSRQVSEFKYYDFKKADYVGLNLYLLYADWSKVYTDNFNDSVRNFYGVLNDAISRFVPQRVVKLIGGYKNSDTGVLD